MKKNILILLLSALIFPACSNDQLIVQPDNSNVQTNQPNSKTTESKKSEEFNKRVEEAAKINEVLASATPLKKQISGLMKTADQYCTKRFIGLMKNRDSKKLNINLMNSWEFQEELQRVLGGKEIATKFSDEIVKFYKDRHDSLNILDLEQVCKKGKEVYSFFQKEVEPGWMVNLWQESGFSNLFQYENGGTAAFYYDGASMFFLPNALGKNSLMHTQGKDSPDYGWIIESFDPDKLLVNTIEECKLSFDFNADSDPKTFDINPAKFDLKCEKKYEP